MGCSIWSVIAFEVRSLATAEDEIALAYTTDGGTKWTEFKPTIVLP